MTTTTLEHGIVLVPEPLVKLGQDGYQRVTGWLTGEHVGASSSAIVTRMLNLQNGNRSHPHDGSDFHRCLKLLKAVPEFKANLNLMREVSPEWDDLVDRWDELELRHRQAIYLDNGGIFHDYLYKRDPKVDLLPGLPKKVGRVTDVSDAPLINGRRFVGDAHLMLLHDTFGFKPSKNEHKFQTLEEVINKTNRNSDSGQFELVVEFGDEVEVLGHTTESNTAWMPNKPFAFDAQNLSLVKKVHPNSTLHQGKGRYATYVMAVDDGKVVAMIAGKHKSPAMPVEVSDRLLQDANLLGKPVRSVPKP
ncbi:hypothetical protein ACKF11_13100 [Methylobacillus sp. Pita2]|uniref:hypothetical protein n=1 Tax=Methylobacillus sp. Pita2 TaxID=3383245 RepID=UPI0038B6A8EB